MNAVTEKPCAARVKPWSAESSASRQACGTVGTLTVVVTVGAGFAGAVTVMVGRGVALATASFAFPSVDITAAVPATPITKATTTVMVCFFMGSVPSQFLVAAGWLPWKCLRMSGVKPQQRRQG